MFRISRYLLIVSCLALNASLLQAQGEWIPAASLQETRQRHSATLLNDGRLLAAGGAYDFWGEAVRGTCEIYDPVTDSWASAASMTTLRSSHSATLLNDGRVLVTGGYGGTGYALTSCEIYDPVLDTWTSLASMHVPRYRHQAILISEDLLLVIGGRQGNIDGRGTMDIWAPVASCEIYSISANTWTQVASMNEDRVECGAALLPDGRVLVSGGIRTRSSIDNWAQPSTATCEIYDPVTDTWTLTDVYPTARNFVRLIPLDNNEILSVGGELDRSALNDCYRFKANPEKWKQSEQLNAPRITAEVLKLAGGDVMTIGGWSYLWTQQTNTAERYEVHPDKWQNIPSMSMDRGFHSATLLSNGDILVVGGTTTDGTAVTSCEIYREEGGGASTFGIFAIGDAPNDEGGKVNIYWSSHPRDMVSTNDRIESYSIYRRDDADGEQIPGLADGRWMLAKTVPASYLGRYAASVATSMNSSIDQPARETFVVVARSQSGRSYSTMPGAGESFDNRGPSMVENLVVVSGGDGAQLTWDRSRSQDVRHYEIYRGDRPDFAVTPARKIGETPSLTFTDFEGEGYHYYRVVGVDNTGNPGVAIAPRAGALSSSKPGVEGGTFAVGRNYPQPFSSLTTIPVTLPRATDVRVEVFDQYGALMSSTAPMALSAGENEIHLNGERLAPGVYHCMIHAGEQSSSVMLNVVR